MFDVVYAMSVLHHAPNTQKAVDEFVYVLRPGRRLSTTLYHRNAAKFRSNISLEKLLTLRSAQRLVNEVDGRGNPKGNVYSKDELRGPLRSFVNLPIFAGFLRGTHLITVIGRVIPTQFLRPFEERWGVVSVR